jgi:asparagine synthase (glutamine-hydrolysing)
MRRALERARPGLLPAWMPEPLRQDLAERHVQLTLEVERERRFANWTRAIEYRQLYPPEVARNPVGWPLEVCRPYADRRLHEFLLAIPPEEKFAPFQDPQTDEYAGQKLIVRNAMRGIQPESVRTKKIPTHYASVFAQEVQTRWGLYERIFGPDGRPEIVARGYVDPAKFWDRLQQLRDGGAYGRDFLYITRMAALETWLRALRLPRSQRVTVPFYWGDHPLSTPASEDAFVSAGST